jgi:hypothetical protein
VPPLLARSEGAWAELPAAAAAAAAAATASHTSPEPRRHTPRLWGWHRARPGISLSLDLLCFKGHSSR